MYDKLVEISCAMVQSDPDQLRIAHSEEDTSVDHQSETGDFLKLNGRRLGRDLQLYDFMAKLGSESQAWADFLTSVVLPLQKKSPAYQTALNHLLNIKTFGDMQEQWEEMIRSFF